MAFRERSMRWWSLWQSVLRVVELLKIFRGSSHNYNWAKVQRKTYDIHTNLFPVSQDQPLQDGEPFRNASIRIPYLNSKEIALSETYDRTPYPNPQMRISMIEFL